MKIINLRDFYTSLYSHDCFCEVPDEIFELLLAFRRKEEVQRQYIRRNKAYYSLDRGDGIEKEALSFALSAEEVSLQAMTRQKLYASLQRLTDKQLSRLYAHFFLGMSYSRIARMEGVDESTIRRSINGALVRLRKNIEFF